MRLRNLLFAVFAISLAGISMGLMGQSGMIDGIKVTLPYPVTVGDSVLEPGEYEIRRASSVTDQALRIYNKDKMEWETNVLTIPVQDNKVPEDSKVVLHHIADAYYFDKIWIEGKTYGYEFVLPEKARALQRELAETIPARYEPIQVSVGETKVEGDARAENESAEQAERERMAQLERERQEQADRDRQAQLERDRQSEAIAQADRDRQAQFERDQQALADAERDRQAQLERERETTVVAQVQRDERPLSEPVPERLPATASNWLGYLVGGCLLIGLSMLLRQPMARSRN
jgi:hypothetical protein